MRCQIGHLEGMHFSRQPPANTEVRMKASPGKLVTDNKGKLAGMSPVQVLKQEGQLHLRAHARRFTQHLRAYMKGKDQKLLTNCMRTTFYLSECGNGMLLAHEHDIPRHLAL